MSRRARERRRLAKVEYMEMLRKARDEQHIEEIKEQPVEEPKPAKKTTPKKTTAKKSTPKKKGDKK